MSTPAALLFIILLSIASVATKMAGGFPGWVFLKALPVWLLAWRARPRAGVKRDWLLFAGLIFGSGGDVALALEFPHAFVVGLGSFLIGHIFYIAYFRGDFEFAPSRLVPAGLLAAGALAMTVWIFPRLGPMAVPVAAYIGVILVMGVAAAFRAAPGWQLVFAGAVLFTLSDSLIAINKFITPLPLRDLLILGTYYPAQILISRVRCAAGAKAVAFPNSRRFERHGGWVGEHDRWVGEHDLGFPAGHRGGSDMGRLSSDQPFRP